MRFPSDDRNAVVAGSQNARCLHIPVTGLTAILVRHRKPLHNAPREMRRNTPAMPWERRATTQEEKMSVFGSIVSAIFGSKHAAGVTAAAGSPSSPPSSPATSASSPATSASAGTAAGATAAKPISKADVEAILAKLAD